MDQTLTIRAEAFYECYPDVILRDHEEESMVNSDKIGDYRGEDAAQYESQAAETDWHGHEILFGMMYEFVEPDETLLDIGIGTGLGALLFQSGTASIWF
jgi:hypothetical protein